MSKSKDEAAAKAAADKAKQDLDAAAKAQLGQDGKPKEEAPAPDKDKKTGDDPKAKKEDPAANNKPEEKKKTSIKDSVKVDSPGFEWVEQALQGGKEAADGLKSLGKKISNTIGETKTAQAIKGTKTYQTLKSGVNAVKEGYQSAKDKISGLPGDAVSWLDTAVSKLFTKKDQKPTQPKPEAAEQQKVDPIAAQNQSAQSDPKAAPAQSSVATAQQSANQEPENASPPIPTKPAQAEPAQAEPVKLGAPKETTAAIVVDSTAKNQETPEAGQEKSAATDNLENTKKSGP